MKREKEIIITLVINWVLINPYKIKLEHKRSYNFREKQVYIYY